MKYQQNWLQGFWRVIKHFIHIIYNQHMDLNIKFELNKDLDKEMTLVFMDFNKQGILSVHPKLSILDEQTEEDKYKTINEYFDEFYTTHRAELEQKLLEIESDWKRDEEIFKKQINTIFKNPAKPDGKYTGYLSVINCNPRFLENKTFQIFYKHKSGANFVIAHEVLHFFFYDYTENRFPEIFKSLNKDEGVYWDLSEIFNATIMGEKDFINESYSKNNVYYPEHEKYLSISKEIWNKNRDVDEWVLEMFKIFNH